MQRLECSGERPWGVHQFLRLDMPCPRCGWSDDEDRALPLASPAASPEPPEAIAA